MSKIRILCFGDSLTWGYNPDTHTRYSEDERWTGLLQQRLGEKYTVVEEGQNGRTIATDDPAEGEKNGLTYITPCLESQSPFSVVIIMLGTNDLKRKFNYSSMDVAGEMEILIKRIKSYIHFSMNDTASILLVSPPYIGPDIRTSWLGDSFGYERAREVSIELANWYKMLAKRYDCAFLDAAMITEVSESDSCHLSLEGNKLIAEAIFLKLQELLTEE